MDSGIIRFGSLFLRKEYVHGIYYATMSRYEYIFVWVFFLYLANELLNSSFEILG